ncbi:MAG TPA: CdaR family protein [Tetragenococcus sp.]|nr:CdaR family protein [Tetragenococcus sp.]
MSNHKKNSNIVYVIAALFFSLVLFLSVNRAEPTNSLTATDDEPFEETVKDIPVTINYDDDKYFIQGYDPTVNIRLSGKNRVQLQAEKNEETRRFKVVADLTDLSEGTHDVALKVENLSNSVSAKLNPATFTVTIEKKASQEFTVDTTDLADRLQTAYELEDYTIDPQKVEVTTGNKTIKEIDKVKLASDFKNINNKTSKKVALVAVNKDGDELATIIEPKTVNVDLSISVPHKEVSLLAVQTGTSASGISHYNFQLSENNATITGSQNLLDNIDSLEVPIDITGVSEPTTREVNLNLPENVSSDQDKIKVNITPVFENQSDVDGTDETTQESETTSQTAASSTETQTTEITETTQSKE